VPTDADAPTVEFFFDPACPWTWITSRWMVDVAEQAGIDVEWHALSLGLLNAGSLEPTDDTPEEFRPRLALSAKALRIVEQLASEGRNDEVGRFYTALGTAVHVDQQDADDGLLADALASAGIEDLQSVGDDHSLDDLVKASHERAQSLVSGDDTGSPVISVGGNAMFGPIVSPAPTGDEALKLWGSVQALIATPQFFELKRNRTDPPKVK